MVDHLTRSSSRRLRAGSTAALALALTAVLAAAASAASPVPLGTADSFGLLAGSTITNTGPTTITGDIGLCCTGLATPGFGSVTQPRGALYVGPGTLAATAQNDLDVAYANAASQPVTNTVAVDLSLTGTSASPLLPGVYQSTARGALQINTGLTLDFKGDPNAVFIFQGTTLTTAVGAGGSVNIVNGGATPSTCNIYWQLADATQGVTLGTNSAFKGTTMSLGASVLASGATVEGRILTRRSKAVTLDTNTIRQTGCTAPPVSGGGTPGGGTPGGGTTPGSTIPGATTPTGDGTTPGVTTPTGGGTTPGIPTPTAPGATPSAPSPGGSTPGVTPVAAVLPGTARISGPNGPVSGPFVVSVTGRAIKSVVFSVDGRRIMTVNARTGRRKFKLRIDPRRQSRRVHRVTARVTFAASSRTPRSRLGLTYRRTGAPASPPRFPG